MFMWILIALAVLAAFYAQDLPKFVEKVKVYANKAKDACQQKAEQTKNKKK